MIPEILTVNILAHSLTYPLEIIKVHIQLKSELLKPKKSLNPILIARNIFQKYNLRGFYKGMLLNNFTILFSYFTKHHVMNYLQKYRSFIPFTIYLNDMITSQFLTNILINPFRLILLRIQSELYFSTKLNEKTEFFSQFQEILKKKNLGFFFKGLYVSSMKYLVQFSSYFFFVILFDKITKASSKYDKNLQYFIMVFSHFLSLIISLPLDNINTKFQRESYSGIQYSGIFNCLKLTIQREGIKGLFSGWKIYFILNILRIEINFRILNRIAISKGLSRK